VRQRTTEPGTQALAFSREYLRDLYRPLVGVTREDELKHYCLGTLARNQEPVASGSSALPPLGGNCVIGEATPNYDSLLVEQVKQYYRVD
jgi:hypothetical protein